MDFSHPTRRRQSEPALPMINVVFLLLIFFLMSAQIVAPPPIDVTPPVVQRGDAAQDGLRLHMSAEGALALDDLRDADVWDRFAEVQTPSEATVLIRADAALPAAQLASVLARISALGFEHIQLATDQK
ncbi:outer membrane transport energization protein ExbD [Roseovarius lutimaris]|uniref:Outer membrane transport energization protein ExbD n=1 Tax=Roseovarius lutimaris TaxID=1005928 RepID=A0A1I5H2M0_9RHOB|nr:biopolymer transporter ExbD [Roseovarius lutimaris]SFO42360.1 outer membrane transport energization protein ExbD [Roseovarius lutimaris]